MNRQTILVDDVKEMVRIYSRESGKWVWFKFDEFLKSGLRLWKMQPICRLNDLKRRCRG